MRNHKKEAQGIRKRQKTYSKYFMWTWIALTPTIICVIGMAALTVKVKIEITEVWEVINNQGYAIERLEALNER